MFFLNDLVEFKRTKGAKDKVKRKSIGVFNALTSDRAKQLYRAGLMSGALGAAYLKFKPQVNNYVGNTAKQSWDIAKRRTPEIIGNAIATSGLLGVGGIGGKLIDDISDSRAEKAKQTSKKFILNKW